MSAPFFDMDVDYAFPFVLSEKYLCTGMTLRDYFAAKAMQGMLANPNQDYAPLTVKAQEAVVAGAYEMADAMIKARSA